MSDIDETFGKDFFCEHGYAPDLRSHCVPCSVKEATDTLKAENERLKKEAVIQIEATDRALKERDSLRKEVERLRGALEKIASEKHCKGCRESKGIRDYCNCTEEIAKQSGLYEFFLDES